MQRDSHARETVVMVHGLWMTGLEMIPLQRHLERCGFACHRFHYPSVAHSPADNARRLDAYVRSLGVSRVHFVTHSLGALVVRYLFHLAPMQPPGRIVMLGPPLSGSVAARRLSQWRWGRWILGRSFKGGLDGDLPRWHGGRPLGVVAGTRPLGLAHCLLHVLRPPHDGVVELAEACPDWVGHCYRVRHGHLFMLFARDTAQAVCSFLRKGRFPAWQASEGRPGGAHVS